MHASIRLPLVLLIAGVFAFASSFAADPVKLPAREKFHLYLLIGQSNMAGRGIVAEIDKVPYPRVLKLTKEITWVPATDPLHFDKPSIAGVGLGSSFGRRMARANQSATIGLIPCAVGGTPLSRWSKGGDLYNQALLRARLAMHDGTLKGILWHQGESDSSNEVLARTYGERLAQMVRDLRADLGEGNVPFVAGKLGEFLDLETKSGNPSYWPLVNEQIASLPTLVTNVAVVESKGLRSNPDKVHFDSNSQREFGIRYASAMKKLQARKH